MNVELLVPQQPQILVLSQCRTYPNIVLAQLEQQHLRLFEEMLIVKGRTG